MNILTMAEKLGFDVVCSGEGGEKSASSVYCCDLLSIVMGRAKADSAWITVMANTNTIAVAVLADVACVILSEGVNLDDMALKKAESQGVCVLKSELPTFEIAVNVASILGL